MGGKSSTKSGTQVRKGNDIIDLKPLKRPGRGQGGSGSGGGSYSEGGKALVCDISFEAALPVGTKLADGTRLSLRQKDAAWVVYAAGEPVMTLRNDRGAMLTACGAEGYHYSGTVTTKGGRKYGEFKRTP